MIVGGAASVQGGLGSIVVIVQSPEMSRGKGLAQNAPLVQGVPLVAAAAVQGGFGEALAVVKANTFGPAIISHWVPDHSIRKVSAAGGAGNTQRFLPLDVPFGTNISPKKQRKAGSLTVICAESWFPERKPQKHKSNKILFMSIMSFVND